MSLTTWKREFYRKEASKCSRKEAVEHSIRKWTGLLKKNMRKHGLAHRDQRIEDDEAYMDISTDTCALCQLYFDRNAGECPDCPLNRARDGVRCDLCMDGEKREPYQMWRYETGDARPMLKWLRRVKKLEERNG